MTAHENATYTVRRTVPGSQLLEEPRWSQMTSAAVLQEILRPTGRRAIAGFGRVQECRYRSFGTVCLSTHLGTEMLQVRPDEGWREEHCLQVVVIIRNHPNRLESGPVEGASSVTSLR